VNAGEVTRQIRRAISPGGGHQESFDPPVELSLDAKILVSVHYRKTFRGVITISLDPREVLYGANEEDGKQLYRKAERKVEVVIGIQSLPSTVSEIMASCSRFRVLIIGEAGVGKSSLINKVFGVAGVDVSDTTRGQASIDQEYIAPDNQHFIVHDSCGFEAADQQNLTTVRNFISGRRCKRDLKDQLHAVWLCLTIPYAGGRLLEAGVEEFLKCRKEILGDIPLVVVFTKLDLLVNMLEEDSLEKGELFHAAALKERRLVSLDKLCLRPVQMAAGGDSVSHVAVSST
jgi:GTPase SAR1 family protein